MGLIDRIASDTALSGAHALAQEIVGNAPLSLAGSKLILQAISAGTAASRRAEITGLIEAAMASADYREGARAFLEKRAPPWAPPSDR